MRALHYESDEQLLIEAAQRDPSRFGEIYEANFEKVYAFVVRRVRDRDAAQDLTAEVFHQALANLGRFEWRGLPFAAWLYRIAANAVTDRWKREGKEVSAEDLAEPVGEDGTEQRAMLFQMVDSLPEDQRLVIRRRFVDQRSIREISLELHRSEGAIKQLQFRALQTLRALVRSTHG